MSGSGLVSSLESSRESGDATGIVKHIPGKAGLLFLFEALLSCSKLCLSKSIATVLGYSSLPRDVCLSPGLGQHSVTCFPVNRRQLT